MTESPCPPYSTIASDALCNIQLHELHASRDHTRTPRGDTWILKFVVLGTDNECLVRQRVTNSTIGIHQSFDNEPLRDYSISRIGYLVWEVEATYGAVPFNRPPQYEDPYSFPASVSMSTIGGTQHITRNIYRIDNSTNAPDTKGAIEYDGESVKGIDVPASNTRWRETWKFSREELYGVPQPTYYGIVSNATLESDYWGINEMSRRDRWDKMVGWVHGYDWFLGGPDAEARAQQFRGFEQGSIMFLGATVSQLDEWYYEATFEFWIRYNEWILLPDTISGLSVRDEDEAASSNKPVIRTVTDPGRADVATFELYKHGWDYIEFHYLDRDVDVGDGEGAMTLPEPVHYTLHQTQQYCPFGYLGVPTTSMYRPGIPKEKPVNSLGYTCSGADRSEKAGFDWEGANCP